MKIIFEIDKEIISITPTISIDRKNTGLIIGWLVFYIIFDIQKHD